MKVKIGLVWRIIIAIALAVLFGTFLPSLHEGFAEGFVRFFATFNLLFGSFLDFVVPLIIIAFITPGIANLGKGAGKLLGLSTVTAYISTIIAGLLAYVVASNLLPNFIGGIEGESILSAGRDPLDSFLDIEIAPIMGVMSALLLAFILGIGMASINSKAMLAVFNEFNALIEKVITYAIIPLLPFHIFGIFLNMTFAGKTGKILAVFAGVFVMIIILHFVMLTVQYTVAGSLNKKNPFALLKTMMPAYMTAVGTQSSAATIPVTLRQAKQTGASDRVVNFTVPLFATIHLSGSMITLVSCSIGVLLMTGMPIEFASYAKFIFVLGIAMIAAPGVPGGAVMAAVGFLTSMLGFDESMIALMIALYLAQDSFGTATNVTGDGALALIVDRFSKNTSAS